MFIQALYDINEAQREIERQQQLEETDAKLDLGPWSTSFDIRQEGRYLVKEGPIKVEQYREGRRKDTKMYMFLFNDTMLLTKIKKRSERESWVCHFSFSLLDLYEAK